MGQSLRQITSLSVSIQTIHSLEELKSIEQSLHIALGVFDGVHIGHQEVIRSVVDAAQAHGGIPAVLTFEPHPIRVLAPHVAPSRILAHIHHKEELLVALGIEILLVISFTEEFSQLEAEVFLGQLAGACQNLETLAMGEDWKFGKQRGGNVDVLRRFGLQNHIEIKAIEAVMLDGERVSSTRIRQAIRDGNMDSAAKMLGRDYSVLGTVIEGKKVGRTIGFPTANLRDYNEQLPLDGAWAVDVTLGDGSIYRGAGNLGVRPTVEGEVGKKMLEIYLLDFQGDLYGRDVVVHFLKHVRHERVFDSLEELKKQILEDVKICRAVGAV